MSDTDERFKLLELYKEPLSGPMLEVYAAKRREIEEASKRASQQAQELRDTINAMTPHAGRPVVWRTKEDIVSLCAEHAMELVAIGFTKAEGLRPVFDDDEIATIVSLTGQLLDDVRALHAHYFDEKCALCGVHPSENYCLTCKRALHLQWPAVYCSNKCALEDV